MTKFQKGLTLVIFSFCIFLPSSYGQQSLVQGFVTTTDGIPLLAANIGMLNSPGGTVTDENGFYSLKVPVQKKIILSCSYIGYFIEYDTLLLQPGDTVEINFILKKESKSIGEIRIGIEKQNTRTKINMKAINQIPNSSNNIETLLKTFGGVTSGNELSSQYNVRGGNFDENLIYVNDIEIYRPLLVQSAQQEGLSFINPNMVSSIQFSAGGFESEFGDKMSSVLDIQYMKPKEFTGFASASLLGADLHLAGISKNKKFTHNTGLRYKTTKYLLGSLDVTGEYLPRFGDLQTYLTYEMSSKSSLSFLGNYSTNRFSLMPTSRSTDFGTIQQTLNFTVFYEGQEKDRFDSYMGALSYIYKPANNTVLKFIASSFQTDEEITYDILSEYWINAISRTSSSNDTTINIGTGGSLEHARDYLTGTIHSIEHKGLWSKDNNILKWGLKFQHEYIDDRLKEWRLIDSAGMTTPFSEKEIGYDYSVGGHNTLNSFRYQAYLQNSNRIFLKTFELNLNYGLRANYWDYNNDLLISPRFIVSVNPYWKRQFNFYFATGLYGQPPFYKELKDYSGLLYPDKRAQKSWHFVLGSDYHYKAWDGPFIFTTEIYYKYLYNIIPYKIDNIEIEYMPQYLARGYAMGVDLRLTGEFVPGVDSWFSLSYLETMEDTYNDYYKKNNGEVVYPGFYRRPSDQRITFSVFFQDYLPSNPDYKVHLLINYGTGLPYSGPYKDRPSQVFLLNQYRRVDVGFSRIIKRQKKANIGLNDIWLSIEILNLLDAPNMSSYDWVKTVENNKSVQNFYSVPNYLTGRRFNLKISTKL